MRALWGDSLWITRPTVHGPWNIKRHVTFCPQVSLAGREAWAEEWEGVCGGWKGRTKSSHVDEVWIWWVRRKHMLGRSCHLPPASRCSSVPVTQSSLISCDTARQQRGPGKGKGGRGLSHLACFTMMGAVQSLRFYQFCFQLRSRQKTSSSTAGSCFTWIFFIRFHSKRIIALIQTTYRISDLSFPKCSHLLASKSTLSKS